MRFAPQRPLHHRYEGGYRSGERGSLIPADRQLVKAHPCKHSTMVGVVTWHSGQVHWIADSEGTRFVLLDPRGTAIPVEAAIPGLESIQPMVERFR